AGPHDFLADNGDAVEPGAVGAGQVFQDDAVLAHAEAAVAAADVRGGDAQVAAALAANDGLLRAQADHLRFAAAVGDDEFHVHSSVPRFVPTPTRIPCGG